MAKCHFGEKVEISSIFVYGVGNRCLSDINFNIIVELFSYFHTKKSGYNLNPIMQMNVIWLK